MAMVKAIQRLFKYDNRRDDNLVGVGGQSRISYELITIPVNNRINRIAFSLFGWILLSSPQTQAAPTKIREIPMVISIRKSTRSLPYLIHFLSQVFKA